MIKGFFEYVRSVKVSKVVFFAIVPMFLLVGIAVATVDNQVSACINNKTGSVRVLNFLGGACTKTETSLSWNIVGPKGDTGNQGLQGERGDTGQQGASGSVLHLYDGNGQDLGVLIRGEANPGRFTTYIKLDNDHNALADFADNGSCSSIPCVPGFDVSPTALYFTQPNCTGDAFMSGPVHAQEVYYASNRRNFGYFVPRPDTFVDNSGDGRLARSEMLQDGCSGDLGPNIHKSNNYLVQYVTLPFTEPLAWPLHVQ